MKYRPKAWQFQANRCMKCHGNTISRFHLIPHYGSGGVNFSQKIILKGSVKEPKKLNMFHNYETEKITRKGSDAAENLRLYRVVRFFHPRSSCTTHLMLFSERPPMYASRMMISGGRTEQHVIIVCKS